MTDKPRFVGERKVVTLGDSSTLVMGQSPASDSYNQDGEGLPFYQGNADFGRESPTPRIWCTDPKKIAEKGDILISVRAPIGAVNTASERCCIGRGVAAIRPNQQLLTTSFLKHQLLASSKKLEAMGTGSTFKAVGKKALTSFPISLYPTIAQAVIEQQLDWTLNELEVAKRQLTSLDSLVKSRFVEMFGDSDSSAFDTVLVEDVCTDVVDCPHQTPKYQGKLTHPAIRTSELVGTTIDWSTMRYVSEEEYSRRVKRLKPRPGDVVYAREGVYGTAAILPEGYQFCLGQRTMLYRPNGELCTSSYLLYSLTSDDVKKQADMLNIGSTVPHVNVKDAKRFKIMLPPLELQHQFADFVAQVDKSRFVVLNEKISRIQLISRRIAHRFSR